METNSDNNNISQSSKVSFSIEDFLLSAKLPEKDKQQLVKKYADILQRNGLSEKSQLSLLTLELLKSFDIIPLHAAAIAEAAKNFQEKVEKQKESVEAIVKQMLQKTKLNPLKNTESNIPLQERSKQLQKVISCVVGNLEKMEQTQQKISNNAKTDYLIPVFAGGSGIGKTTLAYESSQELFRQWKDVVPDKYKNAKHIYMMIDFSNGVKFTDKDEELSPSVILGLRLAFTYFFKGKCNMNFTEFLIILGTDLKYFGIGEVVDAICKDMDLNNDDEQLFILLHIDEVQYVFDFEKQHKTENPKKLFKLLIYEICSFLTNGRTIIQPFISGTAHQPVMKSKEPTMYTFEFIDTPLLTLGGVFKIIEHYVTQFKADPIEWKLCMPFLQLLGDMGGLPRAVSYLLFECFREDFSRGLEFFDKLSKGTVSFHDIFGRICTSISKKYGVEGFVIGNRLATLEVLEHAIRSQPVTRDMLMDKITLEEMELRGHVFLEQVDPSFSVIRMPFLFLFLYNRHLNIIPLQLADVAFNHDNKVNWQDWESFNALYQMFTINYLCKKGKHNITLGDLFHTVDGHDETKKLTVKLSSLAFASVLHRFPSKINAMINKDTAEEIDWTQCRHLLLNGKGAPFGDTVFVVEVVDKKIAKKYFGRPVDKIIVSGQQKWDYNGEDFPLQTAIEEHQKALETAANEKIPNNYGIITVIFTTQEFPKENIKKIPKDILIIHQDNFKNYYGPFSTRSSFSVAQNCNPNLADIQHLKVLEGVGEETAKQIVLERRKRPFSDIDDFCERVPQIKKPKLKRKVSYFPISSERLLVPFLGFKAT